MFLSQTENKAKPRLQFGKFFINSAILDITRLVGLELNPCLFILSVPFNLVQSQQVLTTLKDGTQNFHVHASKLLSLYQLYFDLVAVLSK